MSITAFFDASKVTVRKCWARPLTLTFIARESTRRFDESQMLSDRFARGGDDFHRVPYSSFHKRKEWDAVGGVPAFELLLARGHEDEHSLLAAFDAQQCVLLVLRGVHCATQVRGSVDRLVIGFDDQIAFAQTGYSGRAALLDVGDDCTFFIFQTKLAGESGRERLNRNTEAAGFFVFVAGAGGFVVDVSGQFRFWR
jgi:hypothetical protein